MLTAAPETEFSERGYVLLPKAFDPLRAIDAADEIWDYLRKNRGVVRHDPSSWQIDGPWLGLKELRQRPAFRSLRSPALRSAIDGLLGRENWTPLEHWGGFLVNFPNCEVGEWRLPTSGWHVDFQLTHRVGSAFGVQTFVYLTDVQPRGGGTLVVPGSHRLVERFVSTLTQQDLTQKYGALRDRFHMSDPWLMELNSGEPVTQEGMTRLMEDSHDIVGVPVRLEELCAKPGDAILAHPWLVHMVAPNAGLGPRFVLHRNIQSNRST